MSRFLQTIINTDNLCEKNYFIKNNITGEHYKYSSNVQITIGQLAEYFNETGHALAIDLSMNYNVPFVLDLDCKNCKQNKCDDAISYEIVDDIIIPQICNILVKPLNMTNQFLANNLVVFKKKNDCNLHIYFNFSISIILWHRLHELLSIELSDDILTRYKVDDISTIDFPYSTKNGLDIYKPFLYQNENYKSFIVSNRAQFYDVPLNTSLTLNLETDVLIGEFSSQFKMSEWYNEVLSHFYITSPIELETQLVKNTNKLILNVKLSNVKFETNFTLLNLFISGNIEKETSDYYDDIIIENHNTSEYEKSVVNALILLSNKIAKITYQEKIIPENNSFSYLIKFIKTDSCNFAFYIIMSILKYIIKTNPHYSHVHYNVQKITILGILKTMCSIHSRQLKVTPIYHIIEKLETYDIFYKFDNIFNNPEDWFSDITTFIHLKKYNSSIEYLASHIKIYETLDDVVEVLLKLCELEIPLFKIYQDSGTHYYYSNGRYVEIKEQALLMNNTLKTKSIHLDLVKLVDLLVEENQISTELYKNITNNPKFYKNIWIRYLQTVKYKKPLFNMYNYFIATNIGVFNTLTCQYMNNSKLLYMNTIKDYCVLPLESPVMSMKNINNYILHNFNYKEILDIVISRQKAIYYLSVVVPGLLTLDETLFSDHEEEEILQKLHNIILNDENEENVKNIFYLIPVILKYNLNLLALIDITQLIYLNSQNYGLFTFSDINETFKNNKDKIKFETRPFDYKSLNNVENLKSELSNYEYYDERILAFSIILAVFDISKETNLFNSILDNKLQIEIEKLDSYLNINKDYNFDIYNFDKKNYSSETNINFKRALNILIQNQQYSEALVNLLMSFSASFKYDSLCINDFLSCASMMYLPNNERKKMLLLIGSPNCGKTTIQNFFHNMHTNSIFSIESVVQGSNSSGPAPELIQVHTSYYFNIVELKNISPEILKTITGGDLVHKRQLHQNEYKELKPLAFTVAASNTIPIISNADEAIKDRLVPFMMNSKYVDNLNFYEDNSLLLDIKNIIVKSPTFTLSSLAIEFSNVLYAQFCRNKNKYGLSNFKVDPKNINSNNTIKKCLCKNNYIYDILNKCNVEFKPNLKISFTKLEEITASEIEKYNTERTLKRKITWYSLQNDMKTLFTNYLLHDKSGFSGFGLKSENESDYKIIEYCENKNITIMVIKRYLYNKNYSKEEINNIILNLINNYKKYYIKETSSIRNHQLIC